MYKRIGQQIEEAKLKGKKVIVLGDFNCKVGTLLNVNKKEVTKGGKLVINILKDNEMQIANTEKKVNLKM